MWLASSQLHFAISSNQTFHMLAVRHMIRKCTPSSMNKYKCTAVWHHADAQELLRITRHKMSQKPSVALQYTALLTLPDRNMLLMEAEVTYFHPVNYIVTTVDHSLSGVTASKFIDIECACKSRNLEICVHVLCNPWSGYEISRLERNLEII